MKKTKGITLVEVLIGAAIISVGVLAAISSFNVYVSYALANEKNVGAAYLLEEGVEVMTFMRDQNWVNISKLSTTTTYYLTWNGSAWATTTTPQYVDGVYLRSITVSDLQRDANDDIVQNGGTYDPNTKQINSTVSYWQGHATTTKTVSTYLGNFY